MGDEDAGVGRVMTGTGETQRSDAGCGGEGRCR